MLASYLGETFGDNNETKQAPVFNLNHRETHDYPSMPTIREYLVNYLA
jgi:hypothetical protein